MTTPLKIPNIILINCDDLGYGDLGCYGSQINQTPILDSMARQGVRFTDFYMASPLCSPSRGAMLTGCYPPRIGFGSFDGIGVLFPGQGLGLHPDEKTIAHVLKQAGYSTKLVGKWHCGDQKEFLPTRHGFDSYFGLPYSNDMGIQKKADPYPPLPLIQDEKVVEKQPDLRLLTERYTEEAVRFIRDNATKPFFLYFAHMYVHLPIYVQERFQKESANGSYGAAVASIDWATGILLQELKNQNLLETTLVIFTSDNGSRCRGEGGSNAPLRGTKGTTWEGGLRVPCIMQCPAMIPPGSVCKELTTSLDLYPTLASLAHAPIPSDRIIDGKDISPLLQSPEKTPSPRHTFFYYMGNNLEAVRHHQWKLHVRKGSQPVQELYDLQMDPGESCNVFTQYPDIVNKLQHLLADARLDLGDPATGIQGRNIRPIGRVENPAPLTHLDPNDPGTIAMYDLPDRG